MNKLICGVGVLLAHLALCAEPTLAVPPEIDKYLAKYADKAKATRKAELADAMQQQKAAARMPSKLTKQIKERKEALDAAKARVAELKDKTKPFYPKLDLHLASVAVGDMGPVTQRFIDVDDTVYSYNVYVVERKSPTEAIVRAAWQDLQTETRRSANGKESTRQVAVKAEKLYYLTGAKLENNADGSILNLEDVFCLASGTKTVDSATGNNTLLVIELFDIKPYQDRFVEK